ncbi:MAG: hypothetical protein FH753_02650 [Firmicutes bacterium]|nr:hypothetical protein [Bacillota bacterium]
MKKKINMIFNIFAYLISTVLILWAYLDRIVSYISTREINFIRILLIYLIGMGCWTVFISVLVKKSLDSIITKPVLKSLVLGIIVFVPFIIIIIDRIYL